jgi:hypothetical protein
MLFSKPPLYHFMKAQFVGRKTSDCYEEKSGTVKAELPGMHVFHQFVSKNRGLPIYATKGLCRINNNQSSLRNFLWKSEDSSTHMRLVASSFNSRLAMMKLRVPSLSDLAVSLHKRCWLFRNHANWREYKDTLEKGQPDSPLDILKQHN